MKGKPGTNKTFLINYVLVLKGLSASRRSVGFRLASLAAGTVFFLALLPALFLLIADRVNPIRGLSIPRPAEQGLALTFLATGLAALAWAVLTQWRIGQGTPVPNAPTRKLVVEGPYRYCRNPIKLGAMLYYLGLGTFLRSAGAGLFALLAGGLLGTLYHRFVEEKELEKRFGDSYRAYRKRVPFLLPKLPG